MPILWGDGQPKDGAGTLDAVPEETEALDRSRRERTNGEHDMADTQDDNGPTWRIVAYGLGGFVLSGGGYLVGDTLSSLRDELKQVRATLESRASLAPRLDSVEKQGDDHERRLREVEIRLGKGH